MHLKTVSIITVLIGIFLLSACGPSSKEIGKHNYMNDTSGLTLDKTKAPTALYIRPGAPTLKNYNKFIIDPVRVDYRDPRMKEIAPKDILQMQKYFRDVLTKELIEGGYQIVTRSGKGIMRISPNISGLEASDSDGAANVAGIAASIAIGVPGLISINTGKVTVETAFINTENNRIDAVAVDRAEGSHLLKSKPWSTWADIEGAFDNWAEGIRKAVDKAHGR